MPHGGHGSGGVPDGQDGLALGQATGDRDGHRGGARMAALAVLAVRERTYISRLWHHPKNLITEVAWYVPREPVAGGGGVPLPRATPGETRVSASALEEAAQIADAKNASALLVVHGGKVVLERHWHGHRPHDPTNSASMAKTITSLLVGIAVGEGKIKSLDEPAATWIPAWRDDDRRKITLRHLLQMHAGLTPMGEYDRSLLRRRLPRPRHRPALRRRQRHGRRRARDGLRLQQRELPGPRVRPRGGHREALCRVPLRKALAAARRRRTRASGWTAKAARRTPPASSLPNPRTGRRSA